MPPVAARLNFNFLISGPGKSNRPRHDMAPVRGYKCPAPAAANLPARQDGPSRFCHPGSSSKPPESAPARSGIAMPRSQP